MSGNQNWGFNSIGAIATKKPGGDEAVQLTFPSMYESRYSAYNYAPRYAQSMSPSYLSQQTELPAGDDLQSGYHQIKRQDANRMANSKVKSTLMSQQRALSSAHGYYGMPKPSLSQRRFANPSNGDYGQASTRRDNVEAPFHFAEGLEGGVLRTSVGQEYGRKLMLDRIKQYDAINNAKSQFLGTDLYDQIQSPSGQLERQLGEISPPIGESTKIELNLLLQSVLDALIGGESGEQLTRFAVQDATRALAIIFRFVPTASTVDMGDLITKIDDIVRLLDGLLDDTDASTLDKSALEIALTLQVLFTKVREYLVRMNGVQFNTDKERIAASRNFVINLGFSKLLKYRDQTYNSLLSAADRQKLLTAQQSERLDNLDSDSYFSRRASTREDDLASEVDSRVPPDSRRFTRDERQTFGYRSGEYYPSGGRPPSAYFGEERDLAREDAGLDADAVGATPVRRRPAAAEGGEPDVRGFFDPDTQAFNVGIPREAELPAGRRSSLRLRQIAPKSLRLPTSMAQLPTTREALIALADSINELGGIDGKKIKVYAGSTVENIRKNFKRRLGL